MKLAWKGRNDACPTIGLHWYGLDNPHPEKTVKALGFSSTLDRAIYAVLRLTLADQPLHQRPPAVSYGGPDNWAAAAVVYAVVEGLAGVVDRDVTYRVAGIAPRWPAAGVDEAEVVVHYPHVLLPEGAKVSSTAVEQGAPVEVTSSRVESSVYADFTVALPGPRTVRVRYSRSEPAPAARRSP